MSVIVGISSRSDFTLPNAGYRVLMEIAFARSGDAEDRRVLEAAVWSHLLDLTRLDRVQSSRIAWLLDGAAQTRIDEARGREDDADDDRASGEALACEALQTLLRDAFGPPPELPGRSGATAGQTSPAQDSVDRSAVEA